MEERKNVDCNGVVASLSCDSKNCPVRVNHKVSTTGDGTCKQGDVEISNFPIPF